jgi:phage gp16-like protein
VTGSVRRSLLSQVHLAKRDFGLEDEDYRDALEAIVPGKRSAGDMTLAELERVVGVFRQRGWQADNRPNPRRRRGKFQPSGKSGVRKIWALWGAMGREGVVAEPSRAALRTFVERMTGCTDPEWLSPEQANVVIEGLKAWQRRHHDKAAP